MQTIQDEYKFFIENCTSTPKSYKNYSDFSRVCKTLAQIKGVETFDIYSCMLPDEMEANIRLLESNADFKEYNKKGNNQYFSALSAYLRFLKARQFFKNTELQSRKDKTFHSPLQQIFYGAPGTGKSHTIKKETKGKDVIRTTFHPDSDYSTFVGAYKPTTKVVMLRDVSGHIVIENGQAVTEDKIVYEFVEQAFLQAYINAWKKYADAKEGESPKEQFLIIEEINRGNCAQIFGDLFQLLDRNGSGFSDYPIKADNDMAKHLKKALTGLEIADRERINALYRDEHEDVVSKVLDGEILLLPSNLFIWATMNTSDQSLFPIDSAFKRRWEWKYIPISEGKDENGNALGYKISAAGHSYDWWKFLENINKEIHDVTSSEDKKLGYFFAKANAEGIIPAEKFVGKVAFYLWNDVFKDYGFDGGIFQGENGEPIAFQDFFLCDGSTNEATVERFLKNLGLTADDSTENTTAEI